MGSILQWAVVRMLHEKLSCRAMRRLIGHPSVACYVCSTEVARVADLDSSSTNDATTER